MYMEKKISKIALLLSCILILVFSGCEPDGIEPDDETVREKYIGTWSCQTTEMKRAYRVTISADPANSSRVIIDNFFGLGGKVYALVTSVSITVSEQQMQNIQGTFYCQGSGRTTTTNGKMVINWSEYIANDEEVTSVYTKL